MFITTMSSPTTKIAVQSSGQKTMRNGLSPPICIRVATEQHILENILTNMMGIEFLLDGMSGMDWLRIVSSITIP